MDTFHAVTVEGTAKSNLITAFWPSQSNFHRNPRNEVWPTLPGWALLSSTYDMYLFCIWYVWYIYFFIPLISVGEFTTNLHFKPTDRHQYLHFTSSLPNHTKRSVVYIQALRVSMICSRECDFRRHISKMKTWLLRRDCPTNLDKSEMKKVKFSHVSNNKSQKRTLKRILLVATHHSLFNSLVKVLSTNLNSSRPNPGRSEKIKWIFLFSHFFVVLQKVLWRP